MGESFLSVAISRGFLTEEQAEAVRRKGGSSRDIALSLGYLDENEARILDKLVGSSDELKKQVIADRYEVLGTLGRGGMGIVYKVRDTRLDRVVALKGLASHSEGDLARFTREARMAAQLNHPHIVQVHDVEVIGDECYLTMECIRGVHSGAADLPTRRAVEVMAQVTGAIEYAHEKGIIHRDVKPENILIDEKGEAHLTDFGLARPVEGTRLTVSGAVLGTPSFMSPEQTRGTDLDARSDIYSLGATLYCLLTGSPPFQSDSILDVIRMVNHDFPAPLIGVAKDLETIVMKCLEKNPDGRYATATELKADLDRFLAGDPIQARPIGSAAKVWRRIRRHPVLALAAVAVLVLIPVVVIALQMQSDLSETQKEYDFFKKVQPLETAIEEARHYFYIKGPDVLGKYEAVRSSLEELESFAKDPEQGNHVEVWRAMGLGWYILGELPRSEEALKRAYEIDPDDARVNFYLGRLYLRRSLAARISYEGARHEDVLRRVRPWVEKALPHLRAAKYWDPSLELERHVATAFLAYGEGKKKEAVRICDEGLEKFGDAVGSEEYWTLKGIIAKTFEKQKHAAEMAVERRPNYPWGLHQLAGLRMDEGDLKGALALLDRAIELNPGLAEAYHNRGVIYSDLGNPDRALLEYNECIKRNPEFILSYNNRALIRSRRGNQEGAMEDFAEALKREPGFAAALVNRASVRQKMDDDEGAVEDYRTAIEAHPDYLFARLQLGYLLRRMGRKEEGDRELKSLSEYRIDDSYDLTYRGRAKEALGDKAGALKDYNDAINRDPYHSPAWDRRGSLYLGIQKYKEAERDLKKTVELDPGNHGAYYDLGNCRLYQERWAEAIAAYTNALRIRPEMLYAYINRGNAYQRSNIWDKALADFGTALKLSPGHAGIYLNRAITYDMKGDDKAALADYSESIRLDGKNPGAYYNRARVHERMGKLSDAEKDAETALKLAPKDWPWRKEVERFLARVKRGS